MMEEPLQKSAEVLEELVEKEVKGSPRLTWEEFMALNSILLNLQAKGEYILPAKYRSDLK